MPARSPASSPANGAARSRRAALRSLLLLAATAAALPAPASGYPFPGAQPVAEGSPIVETDLCVYGGTSAGVAAAVTMRRLGRPAVLVVPGKHLGGISSSGLGATDVGNREAISGIAQEFYDRVRAHYVSRYGADSQQAKDCRKGFRFEPRVAEKLFNDMVAEAGVPVYFEHRLKGVTKLGNRLTELTTENGRVFKARMFLDASYEGDLMAKAGVSYTVGREPNAKYGETLNGVHFGHPNHNFRVAVDPYVVEGDPNSGLLKGITAGDPGRQGEGDRRIQAYCFRMCLTDVPENRIPFPKPAGYDPDRYTLLLRYIRAGAWEGLHLNTWMPNRKTDTNNYGGFSTDNIGMNYAYPEADYAARERIVRDHVDYQQGLLWFLAHDERVPSEIRAEVSRFGLPRDEFTDHGGWPYELYVREARRMISDYVMTERNCRGLVVADDSVGLASYGMDSHNCQRVVVDGRAVNEGNVEVNGFPPYPISYRSIVPKEGECADLLVPVCLSASHIAFGSIRMEPVFMSLAQSAATAAYYALEDGVSVQQVDLAKVQARLTADRLLLQWKGAATQARIDPRSLKGIVIDEDAAEKIGDWTPSMLPGARRIGPGYVHDGNRDKGQLAVVYAPELPEPGAYDIVLHFPTNPNRATNVPVRVEVEGIGAATVTVNQRGDGTGAAVSLGIYKLPQGKSTRVVVSNADTDGYVVADAVQFIKQGDS